MTGRHRFDVRISPEVQRSLRAQRLPSDVPLRFANAMRRLSLSGTRAPGAKKLKGLDLWEIRVGTFRAYCCLVPGSGEVAVGTLLEKKTKRHRSAELRTIEARVHRWRDDVEARSR